MSDATAPASGSKGSAALGETLYDILTGEQEGRVCRDIPEAACNDQPGNFLKHVAALGLTKAGDGLSDPKLVLAWLLGALGAPAAAVGFLVPVREAGALLPQLAIAGWIRSRPQRKWVWAIGSVIQGLCVLAMAAVALIMEGSAAGWSIVGLLGVFSVARAACSVSHKDVLGKTVSKATRGAATGSATSISAAAVLAFGAVLALGLLPVSVGVVAGALFVAGAAWILAGLVFTTLREVPGATGGGGNPLAVAREQADLLRKDPQLVRFIVTRGLLVGTALSPPFLLALAGQSGGKALGTLGPFVIASGLAAILSAHVWGRLSDRSSRRVLMLAGLVGAAANGTAALLGGLAPQVFGGGMTGMAWLLPVLLFVLMIAHQGVRLGRSTHVVDMATAETRAAYTALSNTIIGAWLLVGGVFGLVAEAAGVPVTLALFALMCLAAALIARGLREVQAE